MMGRGLSFICRATNYPNPLAQNKLLEVLPSKYSYSLGAIILHHSNRNPAFTARVIYCLG